MTLLSGRPVYNMAGSGYNPAVGETVWISPEKHGEFQLPWSGKIIKVNQSKLKILCEDGKEVEVNAKNVLKPVNPADLKHIDDMINLSDLQERSILRNIYLRYLQNIIYTYTGGILVSVNPYKQLNIYSDENIVKYQGKRLIELSPHIFAIGAQALANLKRHLQNQCIVISGETGSGKTESTKLLLNFLAASSSKSDAIGKKIVQANPILEAFGNAKTTKNDNSSRFGKYIDIAFRHDGTMRSACIQHYLLEKARIKSQNIGDRNYHIFYTILAGLPLEEKDKLKLTRPDNYFYLKQGKSMNCYGRDEKSEFVLLKDAFSTLNFNEQEIWSIFEILAAILHIGNFQYKTVQKGNDEETQILKSSHLEYATHLLSVKENHFIEALTHKTILVEGNKVVSEMTIEQAIRSRDAFAMSLYNQLFSFILTAINKSISDLKVTRSNFSIGILDIFGFENFSSNSFEQLCINYANEHLQQFFVNHVFRLEQEEYMNEGIEWENLNYQDNKEVLNLLGLDKMSILIILDEQTKFPKGCDQAMLLKCNQNHSENIYYVKSKSDVSAMFGIKHYAGTVSYSVEGFREKNMNTLSLEWREVVRESENSFLKNLFVKELNSPCKGQTLTLAGQYRQSLESLMTTLNSGMPFFIRCIKPNSRKEANVFEHDLVCQQLRYSGMMETAKIRQIGYPIRYTYMEFILRYRILVPGSPPINKIYDLKYTTKIICEKYLEKSEYKFGRTKVFLKIPDEKLETIRDRIFAKNAIFIQTKFRAVRLRNQFLKQRQAAITIQRCWRGYKPRSSYLVIQRGYLRLQAVLRSRQASHNYSKIRAKIISFQAMCRGYLKRKEIKKKKESSGNFLTSPVPKPRKSSAPEFAIDSYITDIFDNAIEGKIDKLSSDMKDYLKPAFIDDANEILNKPGVMSFQKYAAAHFMGNVNGRFTNKVLDQPLLEFTSPGDQMAAPVLWVTILRFMGDLDENMSWTKGPIPRTRKSIMSQLQATLSKSFLHSKEFLNVLHALQEEEKKISEEKLEYGKKKLLNLTLIHRNKLRTEVQRANMETEALKNSYQEWLLGPPTSLLDKLNFIIGHGILRPSLRDEIYCQLCKQLTDNPNPVSSMYGWILFSLCCTSFPPSPKLSPTILHFLASNGNMLGSLRKLQRTIDNGPRTQPPSAFELSALKCQQKMTVEVFLLDDSTVTLDVDPSTTAREMIKAISSKKNIEDSFGYSIFLSMFGQVLSLESRGWFLLDGISQCEMRASERGIPEIVAPWNVIFRREVFPPWSMPPTDAVSLDLTYNQIIKGISLGEYRCSQECELSVLVAHHYYILYGNHLLPEILDSLIKEVIPEPLLKQKQFNWGKFVTDTFEKSYFIRLNIPEEEVKINVVNFAKKKWPLLFSRYYEVTQVSGIHLGSTDLLLAVNSDGVYLCKNSVEVILKLRYVEIHSVEFVAGPTPDKNQIYLITIRQHKYIFRTPHAEVICYYINSTIDELLFKSKYAVALDDYAPPDDSFLRLTRGDLLVLNDAPRDDKWMRGHLSASGKMGEFPSKLVKILPCVEKPPISILRDASEIVKSKFLTKEKVHSLIVKQHTLELYSSKYFRSDQYKGRGPSNDDLWKFSTKKLWSPLHRSLSTLSHLVVPMYSAILHYMGDLSQPVLPRHTRPIFEPPLQHEILQDELYCLILKQMTNNPSSQNTNYGWELLLLTTCLFPPSSLLVKEVEQWLETRPCEMSCKCLEMLNTVKAAGSRRYPHHWLELAAVQDNLPILLPIFFPNNMEQAFEVNSLTTVFDLVEEISNWLGLVSSEGFSLILVYDNAAISLHANDFLFDAILNACQFPATAKGNETPKYNFDMMFVKKLWMNTYAGVDRIADLVCHYYQELPKYLAGSHDCTVTDAMHLGALIYIAGMEDNKSKDDPSDDILKKIQQLIPGPLIKGLSPNEWMYGIVRAHEQNKQLKSDDAKIMFLKMTQNWPNFGSAFFSVHSSSSMQDEQMTLVVNRNGVCLVHPYSQEIIVCYNYSEIIDCSFNDCSFSLSTSTRHWTWFTRTAQKIADLVNSYLEAFDTKCLESM